MELPMTSLFTQILGGLIRVALGGVILWLVQHQVITESQTGELIAAVTTALVTVGWIAWNKIKARRLLNTALATAPGKSLSEVKATIQAGLSASPFTPEHLTPVITGDGK